jgi:hypothetical protein
MEIILLIGLIENELKITCLRDFFVSVMPDEDFWQARTRHGCETLIVIERPHGVIGEPNTGISEIIVDFMLALFARSEVDCDD